MLAGETVTTEPPRDATAEDLALASLFWMLPSQLELAKRFSYMIEHDNTYRYGSWIR
jgi:hypothetical protein